jgi:hypothetical protein
MAAIRTLTRIAFPGIQTLFLDIILVGQSVGHSFSYVARFVYLRDVWIRTQRAAVASRRATNLVTHLSRYANSFDPDTDYQWVRKSFFFIPVRKVSRQANNWKSVTRT